MPREPRVEYAGAIYHVMNRGNHREAIFGDEKDREVFMKTLGETCMSSGWVVHSFVLMGNHYHLLIETERPTLVKGMQYLNSTYTHRYNGRHRIFGHLFQGRYKALLVDGESSGHFLVVSDYIHMNPVRAKMVKEGKELLGDRWSSAGWLSGVRKGRPEWLRWERVYGELGIKGWGRRSRREYRKYLERRMEEVGEMEGGWKKIRRGWCLGSEGFIEEMKDRVRELKEGKKRERDSWAGEAVEVMEQDLARELLGKGMRRLKVGDVREMGSLERGLMARWIRYRTKVGVKWLAETMGMKSAGGMSCSIWNSGVKMEADHRLRKIWKTLVHTE